MDTPTSFKSLRAAKIAMSKATKVYVDAKNAWKVADFAEDFAARDCAELAVASAMDALQSVYEVARAQGFCVMSIYCGEDDTRVLIADNMD